MPEKDLHKQALKNNDEYWRYAARCKHCGQITECAVDQSNFPNWYDFKAVILLHYYPTFMRTCEYCNNEAVFELTAISKDDQ